MRICHRSPSHMHESVVLQSISLEQVLGGVRERCVIRIIIYSSPDCSVGTLLGMAMSPSPLAVRTDLAWIVMGPKPTCRAGFGPAEPLPLLPEDHSQVG